MNYDANCMNNEHLNAYKRLRYSKLFKAITLLIAVQNHQSQSLYWRFKYQR